MGWANAVLLGLTVLGSVLVGCAPDCTPESRGLGPNVVLLTVDTLRADHLGCYGNPTVRTPEMDRLAAEGALFERCYAPTNATVPSHISIFSSLPVADHGLLSNAGELDRSVVLLPHVFSRAGYGTAAVVSAKHVGPEFGLGSVLTDLDLYDAPRRISEPWRAEETNRRATQWIRGACKKPFFLWVHYWDPHMPYTPPRAFDRAYYRGDPYDTRHTSMDQVKLSWRFYDQSGLRRVLASRETELEALQQEMGVQWRELRRLILHPQDLSAYTGDPAAELELKKRLGDLAAFLRQRLLLRPRLADWLTDVRDVEFPRAQYAAEVSYVDRQIGWLRAEIERLGIGARTILIVTADHGESLGEHGIYFAHAGLYEPTLRVPLIIWSPGRVGPGRHPEMVRGIDVAPTVLGLAGLPVPGSMQGRDLFDTPSLSEPIVAEGSYGGRQVMLRQGRWKLIRTREDLHFVETFAREAGATELYDLRSDPGEQKNLAGMRPDVLGALGGGLDAWLAARIGSGGGARVEPETGEVTPVARRRLEALRALGYVE